MFPKYDAFVGFEFEFYSDMKPISVRSSLRKLFGIPVRFVDIPDGYGNVLKAGEVVLTIDKSGGADMYEVVTPPLSYVQSKDICQKMCTWVGDFGSTTKQSGVHVNISLKNRVLKNRLDVMKFILSFDESLVYELFPDRKGNIYCNSIKSIFPKNPHITFIPEYKFNYLVPSTKYFGVNFTKLEKNYLEYRYIGGENYHKKIDKILTLTDYFIQHMSDVLEKPKLRQSDIVEFYKIIEPVKKIKNKLSSYEAFKAGFPKIDLRVNMKSSENHIKAHWSIINDMLFDLLTKNNLRGEMTINYNSNYRMLEIAGATSPIIGIHLNNLGFYDCEIRGVVNRCIIKNCTLTKTSAYFSKIYHSILDRSKTFDSIVDSCEFNNVYVSNPTTLDTYISGEFNDGVIAQARYVPGTLEINQENKESGLIKIINLEKIEND